MSSKATLKPYQTVTDGSMATTVTSLETDVQTVDNIGIQATFTGAPVGTFTVEGSVNGSTWIPLEFSEPVLATGSGDDLLFNIKQFPYAKIRLKYVPDSGTGTLNAWITAKRLGG